MKWQVAVDGRTIEIDSEQLASVIQVEPGVYSVVLDGASYEIRVIETSHGLSAEVGGWRFSVEVRDPRDTSRGARASIGSGRQNIAAPMPGKVVRVLVQRGRLGGSGTGPGGSGSDENAKRDEGIPPRPRGGDSGARRRDRERGRYADGFGINLVLEKILGQWELPPFRGSVREP